MTSLRYKRLSKCYKMDSFDCGDDRYNEFIIKEALSHQKEKLSITYIFFQNDVVIGYVTLSAGDLNKNRYAKLGDMTNHTNIPGLFLAQIAITKTYQGQGLGSKLLKWVLAFAQELSDQIGCRLVYLECEDSNIEFYRKNGFELISSRRQSNRNIMFIDIMG